MGRIILALLICNLMTLVPAYIVAGYHSINLEIQNNLSCDFEYVNSLINGGGTVSSFYTIPPNKTGTFFANNAGKGLINSGEYLPETMRGILTLKNACLSEEEFLTIFWQTGIRTEYPNMIGYHVGPETATRDLLSQMQGEHEVIRSYETWKVVDLTESIALRFWMSDQADANATLVFFNNSPSVQPSQSIL